MNDNNNDLNARSLRARPPTGHGAVTSNPNSKARGRSAAERPKDRGGMEQIPPTLAAGGESRQASWQALADAAEVLLIDLERRLPLGMGPLERALAARIREAVAQLVECGRQLAGDELMIRGSTGQRRPHPLLRTVQDLRREISDGLKELSFRCEQRQMYERLKAAHIERTRPKQPKDADQ